MSKRIQPPECCGKAARLTNGVEVFNLRNAISATAKKSFYICDECKAFCGCEPGSKRPLGIPAGMELRRARGILNEKRIDPLVRRSPDCEAYDRKYPKDARGVKMIQNAARTRIYRWIADKVGVPYNAHIIDFLDIEQCRTAWRSLDGVDYPTIRLFGKMKENHEGEAA